MGTSLSEVNRSNAAVAMGSSTSGKIWNTDLDKVDEAKLKKDPKAVGKPICRFFKENICNFVFPGVLKKNASYLLPDPNLTIQNTKFIYARNQIEE